MTEMPKVTPELWNQLLMQIGEVKERTRKLKDGCCMIGRHCMFNDLIYYIGDIEQDLKSGGPHALVGEAQRKAVRSGEVLGKLAVSCCTQKRDEEYAECIRLLRRILFVSFLFSEDTSSEHYFPDIG